MSVRKVKLPVFDGSDPVGWITGAKSYFEVQNASVEVKIRPVLVVLARFGSKFIGARPVEY